MACNQACPYNTLKGCKANEIGVVCPLTNTIGDYFEAKEQPDTADGEKQIAGEWSGDYDSGGYVLSCSLCGEHYWIEDEHEKKPNYCPNCGARMKGVGVSKYKEIIELYDYCQKIGVHAEISPLFDGYCIRFKNGGDVIQHLGSYGHDCGCVEFAIGSRLDYKACPLKNAKRFISRNKDKLNQPPKGE